MDIYLHIGSGKTGTTSIQASLFANRRLLSDHGYHYSLAAGRERHALLALSTYADERIVQQPKWHTYRREFGWSSPEMFRQGFTEALRVEFAETDARSAILSDEAMFGLRRFHIESLVGLLEPLADNVHLVVYLRRQDDHMVSRYQQSVKTGETRTLPELAALDRRLTYDYWNRLQAWAEVLQPTSITVRPFERSAFAGGSLLADFLQQVGLPGLEQSMAQVPTRNESLDANAVKFLRLWNLQRVNDDGARPGFRAPKRHLDAMRPVCKGPILSLPEDDLDRWMEQWDEPNAKVAATYLPERGDRLFEQPRRTRDVTTDLRLSPRAREEILRHLDLPLSTKNRIRYYCERQDEH